MFYLIDKPSGYSSFDVLRSLRKIIGIRKMGHTGTLDPFATGCLLIATENSTKLIPLLEQSDKRYRAMVRIDGTSETLDTDSRIEYLPEEVWRKKLLIKNIDSGMEGLGQFLLHIRDQIPPKYSALKIDGKRSYDRARSGEDFSLPSRIIRIKDVVIHSLEFPKIDIELTVSSGTYIRSLAPIIGEYFGTNCGYLEALDRVSIILRNRVTLSKLQAQKLTSFDLKESLAYEYIFPDIETLTLNEVEHTASSRGIPIPKEGLVEGQQYFLGFGENIFGLAVVKNGLLTTIRNSL